MGSCSLTLLGSRAKGLGKAGQVGSRAPGPEGAEFPCVLPKAGAPSGPTNLGEDRTFHLNVTFSISPTGFDAPQSWGKSWVSLSTLQ